MNDTEIRLEVPFAPVPYRTRRSGILGYELWLHNTGTRELNVQRLQVTSPEWGYTLLDQAGDELRANTFFATPEYKRPEKQEFLHPDQAGFPLCRGALRDCSVVF